ncbi:MAG: D-alanyl-D-alanine carboxypeptidase [Armatimonadetes bacterium]|nr:D-alanyl-D-alanine carboxypeptidase [Armatimonadota bacterium]
MRILCLSLFLGASVAFANQDAPKLSATSAIVIDADSGVVLWEKNPDKRVFPASTTKVMTALLLLENTAPGDLIKAPKDVRKVGQSSLHLAPGEKVSSRDMLKALMLRSANDACYAIAVHVSGSVGDFSKLMNAKAEELGCTETHFVTPNGLHDSMHYTTARDLSTIAREAMKLESFRNVVRLQKSTIKRSVNKSDVTLENRNLWLGKDGSATGIKTGFTRPAGHCLVGSATRNGVSIITVIMKSGDWIRDQENLVDWVFTNASRSHLKQTLTSRSQKK